MEKYLNNDSDAKAQIDVFDELPFWSAPFGLKLLDFIDYRANITALDIGFGTGFPLTEIAARLDNGSLVYGIDPWKDAFERVNRKIEQYGLTNIRLIEGVAEDIPLEMDSVDLITSNNGINNVNDVDKVLSECSRVIRKEGQFVLTMNTDLTMHEFYCQFERVLSEHHMDDAIIRMRQHISDKRPAVDTIISKLRQNGFLIKDLVQDQFNYKFASGTAMLNHHFIRLAFMDAWIKLLPGYMVAEVFAEIESGLNKQATMLGGLKLSIPFILINSIKL